MQSKHANEIDLLRFLAAMSVVLFHYAFHGYATGRTTMPYPLMAQFAQYGYLGVQLFFMISGFVILMTASSGDLRRFVASRIGRLYPAYWVCCTITFVAGLALAYQPASLTQYLANLTMLNGFIRIKHIDGSYWSLLVEMQFYFLVSLLLVFRQIHNAERWLVGWLSVTLILTFMPVPVLPTLLFVDYAPFFIAGAALFLVWSKGMSARRASLIGASWALALFHSIKQAKKVEAVYNNNSNFSATVVAGVITLFFAVLLLVSLRKTGPIGRRNWLALGALTYPLYLLHQYVGYSLFNLAYPAMNPHVILWGMVLLMLGAAYTVNVLVERRYAGSLRQLVLRFLSVGRSATNSVVSQQSTCHLPKSR